MRSVRHQAVLEVHTEAADIANNIAIKAVNNGSWSDQINGDCFYWGLETEL